MKFPDTNPNGHPRASTHFILPPERTHEQRLQLTTCAWSRHGQPYGKARTHKTVDSTRDYQHRGSIWSKENILKIRSNKTEKNPPHSRWRGKLLTAFRSQNREKARDVEWGKREPKKSRHKKREAGSTIREAEVEVKARSTKRGNGSQKSNT